MATGAKQSGGPEPVWLSRRLTESMFGAPSTMAIYVARLCVADAFLWHRSSDRIILLTAALALLLTVFRSCVLIAFWRTNTCSEIRNDRLFVAPYSAGAWIFALDLAALMVRAVTVGELPSIVMSIVMLAGFLVGLIMRAAVLRFAIPSLTFLFGPMIIAGACSPDGDYIVISMLLLLLCLACVRYAYEACAGICAQLSAERKLAELVGRDSLTGLANRAGLHAHIEALDRVRCARSRALSVALVDLDGFKLVNDRHGHAAGDELLRQVAMRMSIVGPKRFIARLGGDEFVFVFDPEVAEAEAALFCRAIIAAINEDFVIFGTLMNVSASIGLTRSGEGTTSFDESLELADRALYGAKAQGKGRVHRHGGTDAAATKARAFGSIDEAPRLVS